MNIFKEIWMSPPTMRARHFLAWACAVCALFSVFAALLDFCSHHWILGIIMVLLTVWNTVSSHVNYTIYQASLEKKVSPNK